MSRTLIVNADDLGLSDGVNAGILRAYREGILTSASLMVRGPAALAAVQMAEGIDLGLHIDLGEWAYCNGKWIEIYRRAPLDDYDALEREIHEQVALFKKLTGDKPSHLDSHQHVHLQEPIRGIAAQVAADLGAPLRGVSDRVHYCGNFYGQSGKGAPCAESITVEALIELLASLPTGVTELGCHPGNDAKFDSSYCNERQLEVETLCNPRVRLAIERERIQLATFRDICIAESREASRQCSRTTPYAAELRKS